MSSQNFLKNLPDDYGWIRIDEEQSEVGLRETAKLLGIPWEQLLEKLAEAQKIREKKQAEPQ